MKVETHKKIDIYCNAATVLADSATLYMQLIEDCFRENSICSVEELEGNTARTKVSKDNKMYQICYQ
jgi:hypothetical protein